MRINSSVHSWLKMEPASPAVLALCAQLSKLIGLALMVCVWGADRAMLQCFGEKHRRGLVRLAQFQISDGNAARINLRRLSSLRWFLRIAHVRIRLRKSA